MIGWSSRSGASRRRRARWWASLTAEEKALEHRRESVANRWFAYVMGSTFVYLGAVGLAVREGWFRHPQVLIGLMLLGHPGGMVIAAFVGIYKKRRVK